jgi:SAM-dependent methyltransferase
MADAWFVDERVNILRGPPAEAAVRERSDAKYVKEGVGIVAVPRERWAVAQTFERTGWLEKWRGVEDDRNLQHAQDFNGYRVLAGRRFGHAIELGCGPFTNLRVISDVVPIERVSLLDPLLESYLTLPTCRYSRQALRMHFSGRMLPVAEAMALPIEDMPVEGRRYDIVVMMNVIEHCFDVGKIFENLLAIMARGSVLVLQDAVYDPAKTRAMAGEKFYEAGHPLQVGYPVLRRFMEEHFEMLYFARYPDPPDQIEVCPHVGRFYFVGERR